ncbi:G1/S-specific cyclin-E-like [Acanthaster planci]|uniref:G1/S-specific cyclin-E-like n=1 Tax=Acanthaster planci TaxID=133434 RepID=A0A8B7YG25_ACAPL|nr:G1/S-specific cyclin-E-like [Acanthaster planci]
MSRRRSNRLQTRQESLLPAQESEGEFTICSRKRKIREDDVDDELHSAEIQRRRQQFQIQNSWVPISESGGFETSSLIPTPHQEPTTPSEQLLESGSKFRFRNLFPTPLTDRRSPLPILNWADSTEVWQVMLEKESNYIHNTRVLDRHPSLEPRMRAILLDWLIEVCEVYRLHRETFYLAADFVDRYLSKTSNIPKTKLQLIGITALFIAAKLEEIYPPKLAEFAYVTDGASTEPEILDQELVMLKTLKWGLSPVTVNTWLNIYLQLSRRSHTTRSSHNFLLPEYSGHQFVQIAQLLDLCILDIGCLQFDYSVIAASALYHMTSQELALEVTGLKWDDIATCVHWMSAFAITVREMGLAELTGFRSVYSDDAHNIQTHANQLSSLDRALDRLQQIMQPLDSSPIHMAGVLTPPHSHHKGYTQTVDL